MSQIADSGSVAQPFRGSSRFRPRFGLTAAAVLLLLAPSWIEAQSATTSNPIGKNQATGSAVSRVPAQEVALPPVVTPPPSPAVEQKPPQPPTIAWDGKQLTIDADNSTLASILVAVRDRTGCSIEIPGSASGERVYVHLGPGPARDVLSSLLYGTSFDYILEAADDDPDTLRKVVLTARGLDDSSSDGVVAGATNTGEGSGVEGSTPGAVAQRGEATGSRSRAGVRMMPGWASSGKPTFQADAEAALAAEQAAKEQESANAQASAASQESAAAQDTSAAQEPAASQASAAVQEPAAAQGSAVSEGSVAGADAPEGTRASNSSPPSASDSQDASGVGQAIQSMTRMFEQRRQIQAQHNQPPPPSSN